MASPAERENKSADDWFQAGGWMLERRPWGEMLGKDAADAALADAGNEDEDEDEDETAAAATGGSRLRWRATPLQRDAELWKLRTEDGGGSGGGAERRLICTHDAANLCRTWLCGERRERLESIS